MARTIKGLTHGFFLNLHKDFLKLIETVFLVFINLKKTVQMRVHLGKNFSGRGGLFF